MNPDNVVVVAALAAVPYLLPLFWQHSLALLVVGTVHLILTIAVPYLYMAVPARDRSTKHSHTLQHVPLKYFLTKMDQ